MAGKEKQAPELPPELHAETLSTIGEDEADNGSADGGSRVHRSAPSVPGVESSAPSGVERSKLSGVYRVDYQVLAALAALAGARCGPWLARAAGAAGPRRTRRAGPPRTRDRPPAPRPAPPEVPAEVPHQRLHQAAHGAAAVCEPAHHGPRTGGEPAGRRSA